VFDSSLAGDAAAPDAAVVVPRQQPRWVALIEILLVSGVPTQLAVAGLLYGALGMAPEADGRLSLAFFATLSLLDTLLVALLIRAFLGATGERMRDVLLGQRPIWREVRLGLLFVPVVLVAVASVVLTLRLFVPWLQTVPQNPLLAFMDTPARAAMFLVVVVLAGGFREEMQRAFVLHRFEQRLGGMGVGLVLFSLLFGLLHIDQGADVAIAVGTLGFIWGVVYIRRRSAVFGMVNHAGFNAMQVVQGLLVRSIGG
jgi:membrane protease YdiL (CAAX protease family)